MESQSRPIDHPGGFRRAGDTSRYRARPSAVWPVEGHQVGRRSIGVAYQTAGLEGLYRARTPTGLAALSDGYQCFPAGVQRQIGSRKPVASTLRRPRSVKEAPLTREKLIISSDFSRCSSAASCPQRKTGRGAWSLLTRQAATSSAHGSGGRTSGGGFASLRVVEVAGGACSEPGWRGLEAPAGASRANRYLRVESNG
jgi:hypothetical protein